VICTHYAFSPVIDAGIGINGVVNAQIYQPESSLVYYIVQGEEPNSIASSFALPGSMHKKWVLSTHILKPFFTNEIAAAADVMIIGSAYLQHFRGTHSRSLRIDGKATFNLTVPLSSKGITSGALIFGGWLAFFGFAFVLAIIH